MGWSVDDNTTVVTLGQVMNQGVEGPIDGA